MKFKFLCVSSIVVLLCFCADGQHQVSSNLVPQRELSELQNLQRFVIDLYRTTFDASRNFVMSPLSLRIMMSLFYYQAIGKSSEDLQQFFYFSQNKTETLEYHKSELGVLFRMSAYLRVVNKLYINENYQLNQEFRRIVYQYSSKWEPIDVTQKAFNAYAINQWIEHETNGLIKELVSRDTFSDDMILLGLNTMYFKAKWQEPFSSIQGSLQDFHQLDGQVKKVQMMTDSADFVHAIVPELDAQVLEIHYEEGSNFVFWLILPNRNSSITELMKKFEFNRVKLIKNKLRHTSIDVTMPVFETETEVDCRQLMQSVGLRSIFEFRNEMPILTGTGNSVRVEEIKQKTKIIVNTDGTEVASGSYTKFTLLSAKPIFRADRPFLYAILTKDTYIPIFMGHYLEVK